MTDEDSPADRQDDESGDRDPFGRLEEATRDRDGDPFEHLSAPDADDGATDSDVDGPDLDGPETGGPGTVESEPETANQEDGGPSPGTPDVDGADETVTPDEDLSSAATRSEDPFTSPDSAFQRMDVGDLDEDEVWAAIDDAQARGSVVDAGERTYAEVSKHRFCESCEYFSAPPEIDCSHEGTEILEFLDVETVRVVDCPIVEERRALERGDATER